MFRDTSSVKKNSDKFAPRESAMLLRPIRSIQSPARVRVRARRISKVYER